MTCISYAAFTAHISFGMHNPIEGFKRRGLGILCMNNDERVDWGKNPPNNPFY